MGLKWFRARIKIGKSAKQPMGVAGFYRTISQFDDDDPWPPTPKIVTKLSAIPVSRTQVSMLPTLQNAMASLEKHETMEKAISDGERRGNDELKEDNEYETPRINLRRESIELMRSGILENNSPQQVYKMKKSQMRIKDRGSLPKLMINSEKESIKLDDKEKSCKHEIQI